MTRLIIKSIAVCALTIFCVFTAVTILHIAFDREMGRQEEVLKQRCASHGAAINRHTGKEICPPTIHG